MNMLQLAIDRLRNQFFLVAQQSMLTNRSDTEVTKGVELGGTSDKGREVGRSVGGVDVKSVLEFQGEGVKVLSNQIKTPDGHFRW